MLGREVPGRRTLFNVNKRPELIERRKRELQQWMWKLVADPAIAGSKALNEFLELADAARIVTRSFTSPLGQRVPCVAGPSQGSCNCCANNILRLVDTFSRVPLFM